MNFLSEETIVKLASILLGGVIIIQDIPKLLGDTLYAIQAQSINIPFDSEDKFHWIVGFLRIFIGFFLVLNFRFVQSMLIGKSVPNNCS